MIHINSNDPEHMKARQNVKPLTMEEENYIIETLKKSFESKIDEDKDTVVLKKQAADLLQLLIYRYENLKYFHDFLGGWEGVNLEGGGLTKDDIDNILKSERDNAKEAFKKECREAQIKNVSQAIDDVENYDKEFIRKPIAEVAVNIQGEGFTHEVNLQTGEEKIVDLGNWIDVKDRLPDTPNFILLFSEEENFVEAGFYASNDFYDNNGSKLYKVTHWQPLPEPPKTLK